MTHGVAPGTRVLLEGPYGVMTDERCVSDHAVLVGAGIGLSPMRAVAEGLAHRGVRVDLVVRSRTPEEVLFGRELDALATQPGMVVHRLVGGRVDFPLTSAHLRALVPDVSEGDLYACGPEPLLDHLEEQARLLGLPPERLHVERFTL